MTDEPANLTHVLLRELRNDIAGFRTEVHTEMGRLSMRLTAVERSLLHVRRDLLNSDEAEMGNSHQIDTLIGRIDHLEKAVGSKFQPGRLASEPETGG